MQRLPGDCDCDGVRDENDADPCSGCPDDCDCDGVRDGQDADLCSGCPGDCDCDGTPGGQDDDLCSGCPDDCDCDGVPDGEDEDLCSGCPGDCDCDGTPDDQDGDLCSGCENDCDCDGTHDDADADLCSGCENDCDCDGTANADEGPPDPGDLGSTCCGCYNDGDCDGTHDATDEVDNCADCPVDHDPFDPEFCDCDFDGDGCLNCSDKNPETAQPGDCCPRNHDCNDSQFGDCDFDGDGCLNKDEPPGACADPTVGCSSGGPQSNCNCQPKWSELWQAVEDVFGDVDPLPRVWNVQDRFFSIAIPIVNPFTGTPLVDPSLTSFEFDYLFTTSPDSRPTVEGVRQVMRSGLLFVFSLGVFFRLFSGGI